MNNQRAFWLATLLCSVAITPFNVRAFDAGSDGSYGALNITTVGTNIVTMPVDGVFRCTTINVATNCTLTFAPNALNTPVYLLAQSNIVINGIIDVSGADGQTNGSVPTIPGPGGFSGGAVGATAGSGQGPGGGLAPPGQTYGEGGSFGTKGFLIGGSNTNSYGNFLLVPIIGGSGGAGIFAFSSPISGGGGGGALLLASSTNILLTGQIRIRGGNGAGNGIYSGGGSGGAVRFVAPIIQISGVIDVSGGINPVLPSACYGGNGRVRIDSPSIVIGATNVIGNGKGTPAAPIVSYGRSLFTGLPSPASPQLYFVSVAGANIVAGTSNNVPLPSGVNGG